MSSSDGPKRPTPTHVGPAETPLHARQREAFDALVAAGANEDLLEVYGQACLDRGADERNDAKEAAYHERDQCIALIARLLHALSSRVGLGKHDPADTSWESDWTNIIFLDLPTGQVSWHIHDSELHLFEGLPAYPQPWDGHTTPEKYRRVNTAYPVPPRCPSCGVELRTPHTLHYFDCETRR